MLLLMVGWLTRCWRGITVGFMKWLLVLSFCVIGCASDDPPTVPGNGTPIPPAMGAGGTGGDGGAGGVGGEGGVGGGPKGACYNESDLEALEAADEILRNIASDCGSPTNPSRCAAVVIMNSERYGECIADCVEESVDGLSPECSSCYGDLEQCGLDEFCRSECQRNPCSEACLDCLGLAGCLAEFEECRGLPGDGCPNSP